MRWPRAGIVIGVIGLVLLGAGWWLAAAGSAGSVRRASANSIPQPTGSLLRQLQQWLGKNGPIAPRRIAPRVLLAPHGTTCPVAAGGFCSTTPCVVFTGRAGQAVIVAVPQPVIQQRVAPGGTTCQGHPPPPRTVPVAGF